MKMKSEYRWLLFILLPFILILVIHFLIPLEFALQSSPVVQESYNSQKIQIEQVAIRSLARLNSEVVSAKLQTYLNFLSVLTRLINEPDPTRYLTMNLSPTTLNNAYVYTQDFPQSSTEPVSMWYAQNLSTYDQLSPFQQFIFNSYLSVQPFIESYFIANLNNSLIGLSTCVNYLNAMINFEYPTHYRTEYSVLTAPTLTQAYNTTMNNFRETGSVFTIYALNQTHFIANSTPSMQLLILCYLIPDSDGFNIGVVCLEIDLEGFANQLIASLSVSNQEYTETVYYLLAPIYSLNFTMSYSPQILFNVTDTNLQDVSYASGTYTIPTNLQPYFEWSPVLTPNTSSLLVYRSELIDTLYQLPVIVNDTDGQQNIAAYFFLQNSYKSSVITPTNQQAEVLSTLLIPSIMLIGLSVLITLLILRTLLNGLDQELNKLNERCKFIVEGDIAIQIPQYHNTKDIQQVYDEARIINKLHKYTSESYFVGHFATKILKYNEALHVIKTLGEDYRTDAIIENVGECYLNIEQFDKAIQLLSESVELQFKKISNNFGTIDKMFSMKQRKQKVPSGYKLQQAILIRRLWKLTFTYFKQMELQVTTTKHLEISAEDQSINHARMREKLGYYLGIFKKALYPNFAEYSQSILMLLFEAKLQVTEGNLQTARTCLNRVAPIIAIYEYEYDETTKLLKGQQTKNKYFYLRNNLTIHSRCPPQLLRCFYCSVEAIWWINPQGKDKDILKAYDWFIKAVRIDTMGQSLQFLPLNELRLQLSSLGINPKYLESTQTFRQSFPLRPLCLVEPSQLTKQQQNQVYRYPNSMTKGLQRQFVFMFDCSKTSETIKSNDNLPRQKHSRFKYWQHHVRQISQHVFNKLIKSHDRLSIIKFNCEIYLETTCNLTLKEANELMLLKELTHATKAKQMSGKTELGCVLDKVIARVCGLRSQKILVVFLKGVDDYIRTLKKENDRESSKERVKRRSRQKSREQSVEQIRAKQSSFGSAGQKRFLIPPSREKSSQMFKNNDSEEPVGENRRKMLSVNSISSSLSNRSEIVSQFQIQIGDLLVERLSAPELWNCKVLLVCAKNDQSQQVKQTLKIHDINRRIWKAMALNRQEQQGTNFCLNYQNNIVYLIDSEHLSDIDRILMQKTSRLPDNAVFIF